MPGIDLEDILAGISVCRNQNLANAFYRLHLIEAYGTGLAKIMETYEDTSEKPVISTTKNSFKIVLPNVNAKYETRSAPALTENIPSMPILEPDSKEQRVFSFVQKHGAITRAEVEELLGISASTASRLIKKLVRSGQLLQNGRARSIKYTLAKSGKEQYSLENFE